MTIKDIFAKDIEQLKLQNDGVAKVAENSGNFTDDVLRYELATFVCEGQYRDGLEKILDSFVSNISQKNQPGIWVSGFFGSGKSHLLNVLKSIWTNEIFSDGKHARDITQDMSRDIKEKLKELDTLGRQNGGLIAISGTFSAQAGNCPNLALLRLILKSQGLPERIEFANFVLWAQDQNIYNDLKKLVENDGSNIKDEIEHLYVSDSIHNALVKIRPNQFTSPDMCSDLLTKQFPIASDSISIDEFNKLTNKVLNKNNKMPLILIAIDEVQQYIGDNSDKSIKIQNLVETLSSNYDGKLLFVATGQSQITSTPNISKLAARFPVQIHLSDNDVNTVVRKVILAKKPTAIEPVKNVINTNLSEIMRQLSETTFKFVQEDDQTIVEDYPVLPTRLRFWEKVLRILDETGTDSQVRSKLNTILKAVKESLHKPLGYVVPIDFLYFHLATKYLQSKTIGQEFFSNVEKLHDSNNPDEILEARACGVIFLINKINTTENAIGIKATVDTIADLLLENLEEGSSSIRSRLPQILDKCRLLLKIDNEYRVQTKESVEWGDAFNKNRTALNNDSSKIDQARKRFIEDKFDTLNDKIQKNQGIFKIKRDIDFLYKDTDNNDKRIPIIIQNQWETNENSVVNLAGQAGNQKAKIFAFIPKHQEDRLRSSIIDFIASKNTCNEKGNPSTPEGIEAKSAMESTNKSAKATIDELLTQSLNETKVYIAGGEEIEANDLIGKLNEAVKKALVRMYPQFDISDNPNWAKVYENAKKGNGDALKLLDFKDDPDKHEICKLILKQLNSKKTGKELFEIFGSSPYGWSKDVIDGALMVLVQANIVAMQNQQNKTIDFKNVERREIGNSFFKTESIIITKQEELTLRLLFKELGINCNSATDNGYAQDFVNRLESLAREAGGDPPKPDLPNLSLINTFSNLNGNELLKALHDNKDALTANIKNWKNIKTKIEDKIKDWNTLQQLIQLGDDLQEFDEIKTQVSAIKDKRLLLHEPSQINQYKLTSENTLRTILKTVYEMYTAEFQNQMMLLEANRTWQMLEDNDKENILDKHGIKLEILPDISETNQLINYLNKNTIKTLETKFHALASQFKQALDSALVKLEPKAKKIPLPRRLIKNIAEMKEWVNEVETELSKALDEGIPVSIE